METKIATIKEIAQLTGMAVALIAVLFIGARLLMAALHCAEWLFLKIL